MRISSEGFEFDETDLKEVFALFTSASQHELHQIDDITGAHCFHKIDLASEYELSFEKREFAIDALRSVLAFLERHGYRLEKNGETFDLHCVEKLFV